MAYTAPRRLRMATADEDVDTQAIANQAANELREQIEASPIPDRLEQVVAEDRPLASRVASADTALVEEPDDSPSSREISFQLREPTGRGAIRSALRTPGLAADLHPVSPLTDEDTGIEPEAVITAKPEAADAEIVEPDQDEPRAASPAAPERDAQVQTAQRDDLGELHKAQRRDRRMAIAGGVLRGVSALAGLIGRATGAPALAGLGGMSGVASQLIPQGRAVEAFGQEQQVRQAQDEQARKAERDRLEAERYGTEAKARERHIALSEQNAASAAENARIGMERTRQRDAYEAREEARLAEEREADRRAALSQLRNAVTRHRVEVQGADRDAFQDLLDEASDAPADALRELSEQVDAYTNANRAGRRGTGGRGGGGGGSSANIAALRAQLIAGGANPESVNAMPARDVRALERERQSRQIRATASGAATSGTGAAASTVDRSAIIPLWEQHDQAPSLGVAEQAKARDGAAGYNAFQTNMRIIAAAIPRVSAGDISGNVAGVRAQAIQDIRNSAASVQASMRALQGLGVPSAAELRMVQAQLPSPDADPRTWINYRNAVVSLARQIQRETEARMYIMGYRRAAR